MLYCLYLRILRGYIHMKKMFAALIVIMILSAFPVCAESMTASLPGFDVTINGVRIENADRQFPFLLYKDITYVPMTYFDCRFLGLLTEFDSSKRVFTLEKSSITCAYRDYKWQWENGKINPVTPCSFGVVVNGNNIDNKSEEYPLFTFREVTYFPLTWRFAVKEFGWGYSFDSENGLFITSDNTHTESLRLPGITGSVATDGKYYYYDADSDGKHVVCRAAVTDTENPEIIFRYPDYGMRVSAEFYRSEGDIYIYSVMGGSPLMATRQVKKIMPDGTLSDGMPSYYESFSHGYSDYTVRGEGISVKAVNPYFDSATEISYTVGADEKKAEALSGRVRVGGRRNGKTVSARFERIQIFGGKIYFVGTDLDTEDDSALYRIDAQSGKTEKLLDGVYGFRVYNGWDDALRKDSAMIIYDNNGTLMRYSEESGETRQVEKEGGEGLVLAEATGGWLVSAFLKSPDGAKTVVKVFDCYASGTGSIRGTVFKTATGTECITAGDRLLVRTLGESESDSIRILVPGSFYSSDAADSVFIYNNTLIYKLAGEDRIVKAELK